MKPAPKDHPLFALQAGIVLAPLVPLHVRPDLYFYTEALFVFLCMVALVTVRTYRLAPVRCGGPILSLIVFVGGVATINSIFGRSIGPYVTLMPAFCLFAGGVYCFCRGVLGNVSAEQLVTSLAAIIAISGLFACIPAAVQLHDASPSFLLVEFRGPRTAIVGNMNQANHFADWLWLSLLALAFLKSLGQVRGWIFFCGASALVAFALMTGSRSVWLYPAAAIAATVIFHAPADHSWKQFCKWILVALGLQVFLHLVGHVSGWYEAFGLSNSQTRILSEVAQAQRVGESVGSIRGAIWRRSIAMIGESPWWGWGPGSFRHEALRITVEQGGPFPSGEHAHNLIFHLAAEMGIPFALAVAGLLGWWGIRVWRARLALPGLWALASLGVIGVHSMLEFPLWFAHFLGLAMVFAAVVDREVIDGRGAKRTWEMPLRLLGALSLATVALLGLQHQRVESAFSTIRFQKMIRMAGPSGFPELDEDTLASLDDLPKWSPWRGYAELAMIYGGNPAPEHAAHWAPLCRQVLYFDAPPVVFARCAMLLQLTGSDEGAQRFAQWGCAGYSRPQDGFPLILRHVAQTMGVTELPAATCLAP